MAIVHREKEFQGSTAAQILASKENLEDFARGAAFLGTGGGGDPYIGRLMADAAVREFGAPRIINIDDMSDDALVVVVAMVGAPTVLVEKAASGDDLDLAITALSEKLGRRPDALMPAEIGGINSTLPIVAAARSGLPVLNADGMGRAFPELQMTTMCFAGLPISPIIAVDEHLNAVLVETESPTKAEELVRSAVIEMGLSCVLAGYPSIGRDLRNAVVPDTLTAALTIGAAIREGRETSKPIDTLVTCIEQLPQYGRCVPVFSGKVTDVKRVTDGGFARGAVKIEAQDRSKGAMEVTFQNEFTSARKAERLLGIVPDLISVADQETGEPIPVEALRFGQRVTVIVTGAPEKLRTPQALKSIHPKCFGLDSDYVPIEEIEIDGLKP